MPKLNRCLRGIVSAAVSLALANTADAQIRVWQPGQKSFAPAANEPTSNGSEPAVREPVSDKTERILRVTPAGEPVPALKYRFWVSPARRQLGDVNAGMAQAILMHVTHPQRAELDALFQASAIRKDNWYECDLLKLPTDDVRKYLDAQREVLQQVYFAAQHSTISPRVTIENRAELHAGYRLPEIQAYRDLSQLISLDVRLDLAEKRYDQAMEKIAAGFRLAELTNERAMLVTRLLSIAIIGIMFERVEEFIAQPDAPNLYWALASLPPSFFDRTAVIDGETLSSTRALYPLLEPLPSKPSEKQVSEIWLAAVRTFVQSDGDVFDGVFSEPDANNRERIDVTARLIAGAMVMLTADAARDELQPATAHIEVANNVAVEDVSAMSNTEAVVVGIQQHFVRNRDNLFKWLLAPVDLSNEIEAEWGGVLASGGFMKPPALLTGMLVPSLQALGGASQRVDTQHKQLLLIEALRCYAALHEGQLPEHIDSLRPMPAWNNPLTGQTFDYKRMSENQALISRAPLYPGEKTTNIRVEIDK